MKITSFMKKVLPVFLVVVLWSCDEDFNSVGADIIGSDDTTINSIYFENAIAYNKTTGVVQSGNLPINSLGVINNPVFGKSIVSYVTQVQFSGGINPIGGVENATITKVELRVPYFSKLKETDSDGNRTFELDSLFGQTGKFRLNIYESGYYLRDYDPSTNFEEYQKYYSNMYNEINNAKIGSRLNNSSNQEDNDIFYFSSAEHVIYEENDPTLVKERIAPQMRMELDKNFFQQKIFNAPTGQLDNNNTLANYFKGLFFQVEDLGLESHLMQLDFSKGEIAIYYTIPDNEAERLLSIKLAGQSVSLVQNQFSPTYANALSSANPVLGDEKIYIKGSEGSLAYIDLFGGDQSSELEELREVVKNEKWLINEANLVFYIDKSQMDNNPFVPFRLYLYNANENIPLTDYTVDTSNKFIFGGRLVKEDDKGLYYKIRITSHIKNLLKNEEAKNVTLGLTVTENINFTAMATLKEGIGLPSTSPYRYVPFASVMNPLGTVLYGNNTSDAKKLKLEIRYTKP